MRNQFLASTHCCIYERKQLTIPWLITLCVRHFQNMDFTLRLGLHGDSLLQPSLSPNNSRGPLDIFASGAPHFLIEKWICKVLHWRLAVSFAKKSRFRVLGLVCTRSAHGILHRVQFCLLLNLVLAQEVHRNLVERIHIASFTKRHQSRIKGRMLSN